jgi:multicomponent Na+:H+ antiporter subunit F
MTSLLPAPVLAAAGALLGAALLLTLFRLVRGPSSADRVVALDMMAALAVGAMGLQTLATGSEVFLRVATVLALVGFLGTVAFAAYIVRRAS